MKTTHPSTIDLSSADAQRLDEFDDLVLRASQGDRRAITAVAVAFDTQLRREARAVMGRFKQDADDVVQDFYLALLEGRSRFHPERGRAIPWMIGIVRATARKYRGDRQRDWSKGDES
jgi:DNA-directed RNA polymerase specialized sigma24 family protein